MCSLLLAYCEAIWGTCSITVDVKIQAASRSETAMSHKINWLSSAATSPVAMSEITFLMTWRWGHLRVERVYIYVCQNCVF